MLIAKVSILLTILTLTFGENSWANFKTFKAIKSSISKEPFDSDELKRTLIVDESENGFDDKPQSTVKLSRDLFHSAFGDFAPAQRRKLDNFFDGDSAVSRMKNITHDINERSNIKHSHRPRSFHNHFDLGLSDFRLKRSADQNNPLLRKHKRTSRNSKIPRNKKCPQLHRSKRKQQKPKCTRGNRIGSRCELKCKKGYYSPTKPVKKYRRCKVKRIRHAGYKPTSEARWTGRDSDFRCGE